MSSIWGRQAATIRRVANEAFDRAESAIRLASKFGIVCSRCSGNLAATGDTFTCRGCGRHFPIVGGIPFLADLDHDEPGAEYKRRQIDFFDSEAAEFEITRPHGQPALYGWMLAEKFRRSVRGVESRLSGATTLTVCGGSGMDAEYLARRGAVVVASDLSLRAVARARERGRRNGLSIDAVVADAEHLPFLDRSIDIVYVHDGLHHLSDPLVGLEEMCRVAGEYVLITEPAQALVTRIAVKIGVALEVEDAGNRVERVSARKVAACLSDNGFAVVGVDRYAMYYRHEPGRWMRFFSRQRAFPVARRLITAFNCTLGGGGNKVSVCAVRVAASAPIDT